METSPLLPRTTGEESGDGPSRRERVARTLESRQLHKLVISFIVIDAACVLADLSYTFLNDSCKQEPEDGPVWLQVLSYTSLAITTLFLIEIPLTLYGFGPRFYNPMGPVLHSPLHLFDAIVIVTTFILEVGLRGRERELASLLIILRLWRLVKLVGGVAVGAGELSEETEKQLLETRAELQETKKRLQQVEEENATLRANLED